MLKISFSALLCLMLIPVVAEGATMYLDPPKGAYGLNNTFILNVRLDNATECVNVVDVRVTYPTNTLRAVDFSRGGSILTLWVEEPSIDHEKGEVTWSGGIPGGYCGRIQGDPALTNSIGRIVFTVVGAEEDTANVEIAPSSKVYLNDGLGTQSELTVRPAVISISSVPIAQGNVWLDEIHADTVPPDPFTIQVESTKGVFDGYYYAVFSTVDKQSGINHFEIFERGAWIRATSPHKLRNQSLSGGVQVKAVDKAGNERLGDYDAESVPPRQAQSEEAMLLVMVALLLTLIGGGKWYLDRHRSKGADVPVH